MSIFPSSRAAGTERARGGGGGRARAGVKLSTLHHKMALGSLREGPESTFAKVCSGDEAQTGINIAGKISLTSDMQMRPPLWQKVKRN